MIELVIAERCTGCNACVEICPTNVLAPSLNGPPEIAHQQDCQTCFMCELYCETDAIYVGPDQRVAEPVDADAIRASGHLGRLRKDYGWDRPDRTDHLADFWQLGPLLREGAEIAARRYADRHADAPGQPG